MLYLISDVIEIRKQAFRKALKDIRVACSGFSVIEIKQIVEKEKVADLLAYVNDENFPFSFE